ncbi:MULTISPECIES: DUF397 domain-containing protein [unclassified Streptomyces]|uniref:DUF397 domain-containing protein n=1 Tax=unclassified Streptomyces TaxID=2593676 RepID=UPI0027DAFCBA|nr:MULTISPECIES: DUF397 domain-containing protein [unclassified Streptomyces]
MLSASAPALLYGGTVRAVGRYLPQRRFEEGSVGTSPVWRRSTYSGKPGDDCVEIAHLDARVHVRDSKRATGSRLAVSSSAWAEFLNHVAETAPSQPT